MISAVRNISFTRNTLIQKNYNTNSAQPRAQFTQSCDSVSFTGVKVPKVKLSSENAELVREFAQKLQLNKLYKFD